MDQACIISISVVICTYNGTKYIDEQIASVIGQSYMPTQVIISDDSSTDDTFSKLEKWQSQYPDIIELYKQPNNLGFNGNFSFGLSKVKGDYVALCDQDDVWFPNKLDVLVRYARQNQHIDLFHHDEIILGESDRVTEDSGNHWLPYQGNGVGILFVYNRLTGHKMFFKRLLLDYILPIPADVIYDWWINVVVATNGNTMHVPEVLMAYRMHDESAYFSDVTKQLNNVTIPIITALEHFRRIPNMKHKDLTYAKRFLDCYKLHVSNQFDKRLFLFLFKNRHDLYRDYSVNGNIVQREIFLIRLCRAFAKW